MMSDGEQPQLMDAIRSYYATAALMQQQQQQLPPQMLPFHQIMAMQHAQFVPQTLPVHWFSPTTPHLASPSTTVSSPRSSGGKYRRHRDKPPYSYIAMIAMAIRDAPGRKASLQQINEYLKTKFSSYEFFQGEYQGWKNSIRHNLSLNDCFIKVLRDPSRPWAKDNYWAINPESDYTFADNEFKRRRRRINESINEVDYDDSGIDINTNVSTPSSEADTQSPQCSSTGGRGSTSPSSTSATLPRNSQSFMMDAILGGGQKRASTQELAHSTPKRPRLA